MPTCNLKQQVRSRSVLKFVEERLVDFVARHRLETQLKPLEHLDQLLPINEFDWHHAIPRGFPACLCGESPGRDDDALVSPTCHCSPKIAYLRWSNGALVFLALEQHLK